jgi:hypothetical protein
MLSVKYKRLILMDILVKTDFETEELIQSIIDEFKVQGMSENEALDAI